MKRTEASAWEAFSHTGSVADYLRYCQEKEGHPQATATKAVPPYAANTGGNYSSPVPERRG